MASIKMNIQGNRGYPDRLFLMPLRPAWLEFKRDGEHLRKLQNYRINQLIELGYDAKWSDDYEACYDWLKDIYAARLSEIRDKEDDRSGVRGDATGSRFGKDVDQFSDGKAIKE